MKGHAQRRLFVQHDHQTVPQRQNDLYCRHARQPRIMYPPRAEVEAGKTHVGPPHNLSDIADGRDDEPRAE